MNDLCLVIKYFVYAFFATLVISPFIISFIKKEKVKQVILNYVEAHSMKSGTPTMGGIIFLLSITLVSVICFDGSASLARMAIIIFLSYGLVGFLDDFIKFKFKRNLGLRAYQKIIFQLVISILTGLFVYKHSLLGGVLIVPFTSYQIDIGAWIIPLVALIFLATTNAVNLTDGLDGLASSTTFSYMLSFLTLIFVLLFKNVIGLSEIQVVEFKNIATLASVTAGAMVCFLVFNCFPAKIFMG
ncbi:MAG: hypothetical protein IJW36_03740, partial [Clostridia bacterium]|nr:hypothetical protein [Clostridia bacterium]